MHNIEPYYSWEKFYVSDEDVNSPFYGKRHSQVEYTDAIYDHYIHPQWDFIGSETLYIKILFTDYNRGFTIIEMIGEWNDALHNDIMYFKRNIVDYMIKKGINQFILIGESVFNFHGSDDCYYEEWSADIEEGWITAINFQQHVIDEWKKYNLDSYISFNEIFEIVNWRTLSPPELYEKINKVVKQLAIYS